MTDQQEESVAASTSASNDASRTSSSSASNDTSRTSSALTPEQVRRIEENRLKAKAKLLEKRKLDAYLESSSASGQSSADAAQQPAATPSVADPKDNVVVVADKPRRVSKFTNYYEYDLSKMVDSRGGFLLDDDGGKDSAKRKWEPPKPEHDPPVSLNPDENPKCKECGSLDLDQNFRKYFRVLVCHQCKQDKPDRFSLLTKTEVKADYLLTDSELRDTEVLPHWSKPNPHKTTWNNMMLYLREQVEAFAFKKWGSEEGLDQEYEKRETGKKSRKEAKFKAKIADMRKRTRTDVMERSRQRAHKHEYGETVEDPETGTTTQTCQTCGLTVEVFEF